MTAHRAFRFAIDPSPRAERALAFHAGARRFAFKTGGWPSSGSAWKPGVSVQPWTLPALRREWNRVERTVAPWRRETSTEAYSSGHTGLAAALKHGAESRNGRRMGLPRCQKEGRGRESVCSATGAIRVDDKSHVVLPRIGRVRTHEPTTAPPEGGGS